MVFISERGEQATTKIVICFNREQRHSALCSMYTTTFPYIFFCIAPDIFFLAS